MKIRSVLKTLPLVALLVAGNSIANALPGFAGVEEYTQVISINNALANKPNEASATRTAINIEYFNGGANSCWQNILQFGEGVTIHAGPTQGCIAKVTRVVISPIAGKSKIYEGTVNVYLDLNKFSNMITVKQDRAPIFNRDTGMVDTPGSVTTGIYTTLRYIFYSRDICP